MEAIHLAWEEGADGVEIDIRLSRDNHIVVIHDATLDRVAGDPGTVAQMNWDALRRLDVGAWKGPSWQEVRMPDLDAVLRARHPEKCLYIEIKDGPEIVDPLSMLMHNLSIDPVRVCFLSFSVDVLSCVHRVLPAYACYWNVSYRADRYGPGWRDARTAIEQKASEMGWRGIGWQCAAADETVRLLQQRDRTLDAYVWTLDEPETARALAEADCPALVTNRPGLIRRWLKA